MEPEALVEVACPIVVGAGFERVRDMWAGPELFETSEQCLRVAVASDVRVDVDLIDDADLAAEFVRPERHEQPVPANPAVDIEHDSDTAVRFSTKPVRWDQFRPPGLLWGEDSSE